MSGTEPSTEAMRWIQYAREDLEAARSMHSGESFVPRHVCWLAQQAAEKALKSALVSVQREFPRTHDLELLCRLLPDTFSVQPDDIALSQLSEWAVEARYPGDWPEATRDDAKSAVKCAELVVDRVYLGLISDRHR